MVMTREEAYEVLNLTPNASESEVKAAYKSLALKLHPDKRDPSERDEATQQFQKISLAYKRLTGSDTEVISLEEKFKDPTFIWYLFCALFGQDKQLFCNDDESSDEDDSSDFIRPSMSFPHYFGSHQMPSDSRYRTDWSPYFKAENRSAAEAAKHADELIAAEEQEKRRAARLEEKRRKKKEKKIKKKQQGKATAAAVAAASGGGQPGSSNGGANNNNINTNSNRNVVGGNQSDESESSDDSEGRDLNGYAEEEQLDETSAFVRFNSAVTIGSPTPPVQQQEQQQLQKEEKQRMRQQQEHEQLQKEEKQRMRQQQEQQQLQKEEKQRMRQQQEHEQLQKEEKQRMRQQQEQEQQLQQQQLKQQQLQKAQQFQQQQQTQHRAQAPEQPIPRPRQLFQPPHPHPPRQQLYHQHPQYPQHPPHHQPRHWGVQSPDDAPAGAPTVTARQLAKTANSHMDGGDFVTALELYGRAIALDSTDCRYYGSRAACLYQMARYEESERDADFAVQLSPAYVRGFYVRGLAQMRLGQPGRAGASFAAVLERDPGNVDAAAQLAAARQAQLESRQTAAAAAGWHKGPATPSSPAVAPLGPPSTYARALGPMPGGAGGQQRAAVKQPQEQPAVASPADAAPPRASPPAGATAALWVGNVMPDVSDEQLCAAFARYGEVVSARLLRPSCCAFVNMRSVEDATRAMAGVNNQQLGSRRLQVKFSASGPPKNFRP